MTTRAVVYLRQSLNRDGTGQAVERQREACCTLAEARGWTVVTEYVDNSVSATTGVRPQWTKMLADAEAGQFDVILVWALDRLTRSTGDLERLVDLGERTGARCATASGDIDLSTNAGRLVGRILAAVARAEIERCTGRQRLANAQRAAGSGGGRPPTGPRALGRQDDGVTPHEDEAPAVAAAFTAMLAGASLRTVAREWNAGGLTTTPRRPLVARRGPVHAYQPSVRRAASDPGRGRAGLQVVGEGPGTGSSPRTPSGPSPNCWAAPRGAPPRTPGGATYRPGSPGAGVRGAVQHRRDPARRPHAEVLGLPTPVSISRADRGMGSVSWSWPVCPGGTPASCWSTPTDST